MRESWPYRLPVAVGKAFSVYPGAEKFRSKIIAGRLRNVDKREKWPCKVFARRIASSTISPLQRTLEPCPSLDAPSEANSTDTVPEESDCC